MAHSNFFCSLYSYLVSRLQFFTILSTFQLNDDFSSTSFLSDFHTALWATKNLFTGQKWTKQTLSYTLRAIQRKVTIGELMGSHAATWCCIRCPTFSKNYACMTVRVLLHKATHPIPSPLVSRKTFSLGANTTMAFPVEAMTYFWPVTF